MYNFRFFGLAVKYVEVVPSCMAVAMSAVKERGTSAPAPVDTFRSANKVRRANVAPLTDTQSCGYEGASEE
jgi:hypothetical protein